MAMIPQMKSVKQQLPWIARNIKRRSRKSKENITWPVEQTQMIIGEPITT